ncbi:MAG: HAD-superfamily subfamily hydrolase [Cyanobacteria bacterium RYN_339]|nr:HAD-superfamily subfamily hydrolase [Cyanobacteria bacterium RYN_339]
MIATYLDFDGTLADTTLVHVYAYYARHAGRRVEMAMRLAKLAAMTPAYMALDKVSRLAFARRLYSHYEGLSRDRLEALAPALDREVLQPREHKHAASFLAGCKAKGPIVLVTGAADFCVAPFAKRYGFDAVIATRLEYRDGRATGRIIPPEVFGPNKAKLIRDHAAAHGIDLAASSAYTDSISDLPMMDVVGRPGVINPDAALQRAARDYHWQILTL